MKSETRLPFFLTWQYLRRGRKWTLALTIFMMSVAFVNLIFISSLFTGIIDGANKQIIQTMTGNIYISPPDGSDTIIDSDNALKEIKSIAGVAGASAQFQLPARLKYGNITGNWQILAIDPQDEKSVTNIVDKIIEGSYLEAEDTDKILIGRQIAGGADVESNAFSFKGAKVGDKVVLELNGLNREFTIGGIFNTKFLQSDQRAFITSKALSEINPIFTNAASTIIVKVANGYKEDDVIAAIKSKSISNNIYTWRDVAGLMKSVSESFLSINVLMTLVGIMIAAITIFIVIYVDIINKRKQIGILRAIGIKPYIIVFSYVILAAIYSVIGVLFGSAIFQFVLVPYFNIHPFVLPICDAVLKLNLPDYIYRVEAVTWVSVLSGLIPSLLVVRSRMLDAILGR